ncbi:hypothetical protein LAZ67_1008233 [Cordylochernes scorpioides]|uniref:RNA-dependent RNA polymerase n=1 Tax=Cordylochernes scorpioides TaxID=51811 RepID=A0ABY6K336_9ARAC|nr:hypothetical protein LAZ67_1008233 [Cordylochernes scorpioides]
MNMIVLGHLGEQPGIVVKLEYCLKMCCSNQPPWSPCWNLDWWNQVSHQRSMCLDHKEDAFECISDSVWGFIKADGSIYASQYQSFEGEGWGMMECHMRFLVRVFPSQKIFTKEGAHDISSKFIRFLQCHLLTGGQKETSFQELASFPELAEYKFYQTFDFSYNMRCFSPVEFDHHEVLREMGKLLDQFRPCEAPIWIKFLELPGFWVNPDKVRHCSIPVKDFSLGTFVLPNHFVRHFHSLKVTERNYIDFCHDQRKIRLNFKCSHKCSCQISKGNYRLTLNYDQISKLIVSHGYNEIYITYFYPPPLFKENINKNGRKTYNEFQRETSFPCEICYKGANFCPKKILGNTTTLCLVIPDRDTTKNVLDRLRQLLESSIEIIYCNVEIQPKISSTAINLDDFETVDLCFKCRYISMSVFKVNYQVKDQAQFVIPAAQNFLHSLKSYEANHLALQRCLSYIFTLIQKGEFFDFFFCFEQMYKGYSMESNWESSKDILFLPKLIMTPYRKIYLPFQQHAPNRILRKYSGGLFLVVSLREENLETLHTIIFHRDYNNFVGRHFGREIKSGIKIGSYNFKFLASSSSQVRDHSFYMYCMCNGSPSADDIRRWIQVDSIAGTTAKKLARMGQCFSSLEAVLPLNFPCQVETTPDIRTGAYTFTDGIGMVSTDIANKTFVFNMSSSKPSGSKTKRKIADEHRNFQEKWELEYFCSEVKDKIICLICNNAISVPKLYNIKRHYEQHKSKLKRHILDQKIIYFANISAG